MENKTVVKRVKLLERGMLLYKDKNDEYLYIYRPEATFIQSLYSLFMSPVTFGGKKVSYVDKLYVEEDECLADIIIEKEFEEFLVNREFRVLASFYCDETDEYLIETNRNNFEIKLGKDIDTDYTRVRDE